MPLEIRSLNKLINRMAASSGRPPLLRLSGKSRLSRLANVRYRPGRNHHPRSSTTRADLARDTFPTRLSPYSHSTVHDHGEDCQQDQYIVLFAFICDQDDIAGLGNEKV